MAHIDIVDERQGSHDESVPVENPTTTARIDEVPGLSYIPDKIEIAEDKWLMSKLSREMLDFVKLLTQILDLMWLIKPKHLRNTAPLPINIITEMLFYQGKGPRLKAFEASVTVSASPSVEAVLKSNYTHQHAPAPRRDVNPLRKSDQNIKSFPFANDLQEITGKKTRPLWHSVMLEKQEELSILKPKVNRRESFVFKGKTTYQRCKVNEELTRTKSETILFSIKFAWTNIDDPASQDDQRWLNQIEMMVASQAGFRTVDEHKAYLSTLRSHWYTNFLRDAVRMGVFTCQDIVSQFQLLARHYHMNYDTLPLAKAKLCLVVMSLPFWDIARIETQRVVEFILEKILLLPEKPLIEWLRVRGIPYVVFPPFSIEDFLINTDHGNEPMMDGQDAVGEFPTGENSATNNTIFVDS